MKRVSTIRFVSGHDRGTHWSTLHNHDGVDYTYYARKIVRCVQDWDA
jgi:hypothetical protein